MNDFTTMTTALPTTDFGTVDPKSGTAGSLDFQYDTDYLHYEPRDESWLSSNDVPSSVPQLLNFPQVSGKFNESMTLNQRLGYYMNSDSAKGAPEIK